jgi:aspartate oxidase
MREGLKKLKKLHCQVEEMLEFSTPNWLLYETRNLLTVGTLMLQQALDQTQNRGSHYNGDLEEKPINFTSDAVR